MNTFTIDTEDNITAHAGQVNLATCEEAMCERLRSEKELAKLTESLPAARLLAIWNSLPGVEPVKRFQSRNTAVQRVWTAVQSLQAAVAAQPPHEVQKTGKPGPKTTPAPEAHVACDGSKKATVLALVERPEGATTLSEIMATTGWQPHPVRGFLSGALGKKMGLTIASTKPEDGERVYRVSR